MLILLLLLLAYLIGSIPTAYLIARLHKINIFEMGSGNMGTSNIARLLGLQWGVLTFVLDALKGVVAVGIMVLAVRYDPILITLATGFAVCGHNWSILATVLAYNPEQGFKIRGGKGAATGFGSFFWIAPLLVIGLQIVIFAFTLGLTRIFSLSTMIAWFVGFLWLIISILNNSYDAIWLLYITVVSALVFFRLRENIQAILAGRERTL